MSSSEDASGRAMASSNSNNGVAAGNAAMSLFERFSNINRGIDEAREEMKQMRRKTEEIQESIEKTRQEKATMEADSTTAYEEANEFYQRVDDACAELSKLQSEKSRALMEKQKAQRELDVVKAFVDEHRSEFLNQSREFRASCKRVRLRASDLGLEYITSRAFAQVISDPSIAAEWKEKMNGQGKLLPKDFQEDARKFLKPVSMPPGDQALLENGNKDDDTTCGIMNIDPCKWMVDPRDIEMNEALERYKQALADYKEAKQSLEKQKEVHKDATEQAAARADRKRVQESRLQKTLTENTGHESDIAKLNEEIQEAKEMAEMYKKSKSSVTASSVRIL